MNLTQQEIAVNEISARVRRIETRLHKLCVKAGVEDHPDKSTLVVPSESGYTDRVVVHGYDVTLSAIKAALVTAGCPLGGDMEYELVYKGESIGFITLLDK